MTRTTSFHRSLQLETRVTLWKACSSSTYVASARPHCLSHVFLLLSQYTTSPAVPETQMSEQSTTRSIQVSEQSVDGQKAPDTTCQRVDQNYHTQLLRICQDLLDSCVSDLDAIIKAPVSRNTGSRSIVRTMGLSDNPSSSRSGIDSLRFKITTAQISYNTATIANDNSPPSTTTDRARLQEQAKIEKLFRELEKVKEDLTEAQRKAGLLPSLPSHFPLSLNRSRLELQDGSSQDQSMDYKGMWERALVHERPFNTKRL